MGLEYEEHSIKGWVIFARLVDEWVLYKFTTHKKEKYVKKIVKGLNHNSIVQYKYERGWMLKELKNEQIQIEKGQKKHVICGTDCEKPCTREFEEEGRDWRENQYKAVAGKDGDGNEDKG